MFHFDLLSLSLSLSLSLKQISSEINGCLDFLKSVYGIFGFTYNLFLSTRPKDFMGEPALWDKAEKVSTNSTVSKI